MVNSSITAGVWLGGNGLWDHAVYPPSLNADEICEETGCSIISMVCIEGTITSASRFGIFAATDIAEIQVNGLGQTWRSADLPWPNADYAANNRFLMDYAGRWI